MNFKVVIDNFIIDKPRDVSDLSKNRGLCALHYINVRLTGTTPKFDVVIPSGFNYNFIDKFDLGLMSQYNKSFTFCSTCFPLAIMPDFRISLLSNWISRYCQISRNLLIVQIQFWACQRIEIWFVPIKFRPLLYFVEVELYFGCCNVEAGVR